MYSISNLTFHKKQNQKFFFNENNPQIRGFVNTKKWFLGQLGTKIDNNQFTDKINSQLFSHLKEVKIMLLDLRSNNNDKIPKIIANISFPQLTQLNLFDNKIASIQILQNVDLPLLKILILGNNLLTCIKSLRKINCSLQTLGINGNSIQQLDFLSQIDCQKLQKLYIQYKKKQKNQSSNIDFVFKMNMINIKQFWKVHQDNIEVSSLHQLKRKYLKL